MISTFMNWLINAIAWVIIMVLQGICGIVGHKGSMSICWRCMKNKPTGRKQ